MVCAWTRQGNAKAATGQLCMACRGLALDVDMGLLSAPHPGLISVPPPSCTPPTLFSLPPPSCTPPTLFSFGLAVCRALSPGPLERLASLFLPSLSFEVGFQLAVSLWKVPACSCILKTLNLEMKHGVGEAQGWDPSSRPQGCGLE